MLQPKKVKHRKWHKGRSPGVETRGASLAYGSFGLKALEARWITARQIEAARRAITHYIQRGGKVWIRVFPDKPITRRPPEVTMGGRKVLESARRSFVSAWIGKRLKTPKNFFISAAISREF